MQEIDVLNWIHDTFACTFMDYVSLAFEYVFKLGIIWFIVALLLMHSKRDRMFGVVLLLSLILELVTVYALKTTIDRDRPYITYTVDALITTFSSASLPSEHTAQLFCVATLFYVFRREYAPEMFLLAFVVAFTRMYMYAHYPTDIISGALLGMAIALFVVFAAMRSHPRTVYIRDPEDGSE